MALYCSVPSGAWEVTQARDRVDAAAFGHGWRQACSTLPRLAEGQKVSMPLDVGYIYIGIDNFDDFAGPSPGPWCNPFVWLAQ